MLEQNSMPEFKEIILDYGGKILWENEFKSWSENLQQEMIAYIWGFTIYAQTVQDFLQPCWIACEHKTSILVNQFLQFSGSQPYSKQLGGVTHTVMRYYPKFVIHNIRNFKEAMEVNKVFLNIPDIRMFRFLNHMENQDFGKNEEIVRNIILDKMSRSQMRDFVPTVKVVRDPEYFEI